MKAYRQMIDRAAHNSIRIILRTVAAAVATLAVALAISAGIYIGLLAVGGVIHLAIVLVCELFWLGFPIAISWSIYTAATRSSGIRDFLRELYFNIGATFVLLFFLDESLAIGRGWDWSVPIIFGLVWVLPSTLVWGAILETNDWRDYGF